MAGSQCRKSQLVTTHSEGITSIASHAPVLDHDFGAFAHGHARGEVATARHHRQYVARAQLAE